MSKKKPKDISNMEPQDIISRIEEKWGEELTFIAFEHADRDGKRVFSCIESDEKATITVDIEGWVMVKPTNSAFSDVFGTI